MIPYIRSTITRRTTIPENVSHMPHMWTSPPTLTLANRTPAAKGSSYTGMISPTLDGELRMRLTKSRFVH